MTKSYTIFKKGSKTYFYSSLFFPKNIRREVADLYAFVRTADNYVDTHPQQVSEFKQMISDTNLAWKGDHIANPIVSNFVQLAHHKQFSKEWVDSFFNSMYMDTVNTHYRTEKDTLGYMYGSAEVIGLMMAAIMQLPPESYQSAQMLGRSMQYINFIRDIDEDNGLGRRYFSRQILDQYHLKNLEYRYILTNPQAFTNFIHDQLDKYESWQQQAETGFHFIPRRLRVPIKTASEMYRWTGRVIRQDPLIIYCHKVKPKKRIILKEAIINTLTI